MTDDTVKPFFRFHPRAIDDPNIFKTADGPCDVCGRITPWQYDGLIYSSELDFDDQPRVCAACIADGRLAGFLGDETFSLHAGDVWDADAELTREVTQRTPGFSTWNGYRWPVLDGRPLAFLGRGGERKLWEDSTVRREIVTTFKAVTHTDLNGPSDYALVFKEIDGPRYQVVIDLD